MSTTQIKEFLHDYINKADDNSINMMYAMIQSDFKEGDYKLGKEHKAILDERLTSHQNNPSAGSSWDEVKERIINQL